MQQFSDEVSLALEGMRYLFNAPLALVVLAVTTLGLCRSSRRNALALLFLLALCATATSLVPPSALGGYLASGYVAAGGLALAAGLAGGGRRASLFAVGGAIALGLTAGLQTATASEALGTLAAALVMCAAAIVAIQAVARLVNERVIGLALRVLGAWTAAVGLLMLALEVGKNRL